ncbi:MAG: sulfatase-like hydrolase/transferase [Bryobacter sp.]|nr:sulfatase-like hydrolase/transferase [Bryobacter sp.]
MNHSSRRNFLCAASGLAAAKASAPARPNILYIMTDQQHAGMMSCTGNPWLKTPALDRLAASGTRFELAYSGNPVCVPARTSMMTGRYPSYFGFDGNVPPKRPPGPEDLRGAMGHVFRAAGYRTVFGGKTHWPKPMTPESIGFEYLTADERDGLADKSVEFLAAKHEQPFLLVASFINPHDICLMAIDAYTKANQLPAMYPKLEIERKRVAEALALPEGVSREEFFRKHCPPLPANHGATAGEPSTFSEFGSFRGWARRNWTAEDWRLHRWAYCRLTERVDAEIGRVLNALYNSGRERDTVVVFSSDHGDMDGAHGFEHKSLPYDESARVPLIVSWPGRVPAKRVNRTHLVSSTVDLLPTLCDFAGIPAPAGLPGLSFHPIAMAKKPATWRDDLLIELTGGKCVRGQRYKYSVWDRGENREMLIDLKKDPGEMRNLANDPASATVLAACREKLTRLTRGS